MQLWCCVFISQRTGSVESHHGKENSVYRVGDIFFCQVPTCFKSLPSYRMPHSPQSAATRKDSRVSHKRGGFFCRRKMMKVGKKINEWKTLSKIRMQQFKACVVVGLCKLSCFNLSPRLRFIRCPSLCSQCTQCVYYAAGEQMVTEYFNQILTKLKSMQPKWESKVNTRKEGLNVPFHPH